MQWFRLYDDVIDDPKVLALSWKMRWHFIEILSISSRQTPRGTLPNFKVLSIMMRVSKSDATKIVNQFIDLGFIDANPSRDTLNIHGWDKRQFKSDDVTSRTEACKERQKERSQEQSESVPENGSTRARSVSVSVSVSASELNSEGGPGGNPAPEVANLAAATEARWPAQNAESFVGDLCQTWDYRLVGQILTQAFDKDPQKLPRSWVRAGCQNQIKSGWEPPAPSSNGTHKPGELSDAMEQRVREWEAEQQRKKES